MTDNVPDLPAEVAAPEVADSATPDHDPNSVKVTLADLCAKGTSQYAIKNYSEAMDYYAQASELQAELNGEMSPENAEILFLYGRCLYQVGQSKSDVLGGKSGGEKKKPKSKGTAKPKAAKLEAVTEGDEGVEKEIEARVEPEGENKASASESKAGENGAPKPFFQFTGDENFEDSEDEDEGEGGEEDEEEEDELLLGFEILDLARVLFERKLQQPEEEEQDGKGKGKVTEDSSLVKHLKERLADTHDLLGDISLENERFPNAISDFRASLAYKKDLYHKDSEFLAEAHFKLSLALEFGSITTTSDADDGDEEQKEAAEATVNEEMRAEAAEQLELAIDCTKLKLHNKEVSLAETSSPEENDTTRAQIADVKEMLVDLEQRLLELRAPPVDVGAVLGGAASNGVGSIADTKEGETRAETEARIEAAKKNASNIQGVVRKKAPKVEAGSSSAELPSHGKRKAEDEAEGESKKTKVDEESTKS